MPICGDAAPPVSVELLPGDILALLSDGIIRVSRSPQPACSGEGPSRGHSAGPTTGRPWPELSSLLLGNVEAFAQGAPQEDDITIVPGDEARGARSVTADRLFRRKLRFAQGDLCVHGRFLRRSRIDPALLPTVDLILEELFTNMVKYSPAGECPHPHRNGRDGGRRRK